MKNVTITIDEEVLQRARIRALEQKTSVNRVLADFAAYWEAQAEVDTAWHDRDRWLERAVINIAGAGHFSSDRTVLEYTDRIWNANLMDD